MSVHRRKGDAGLADLLFSRIVRSRGYCQYPGCKSQGPFDTAHLIGRASSATRCLEDNAACCCQSHHRLIDSWWDEKAKIVEATCGIDRYDEMKRLANAGKPAGLTSVRFWAEEVSRLKARCRELGLSDRRAA